MREAFSMFPWPWATVAALLIFFSFFVALLFRVSSRSQGLIHRQIEQLPLEEGEHYE